MLKYLNRKTIRRAGNENGSVTNNQDLFNFAMWKNGNTTQITKRITYDGSKKWDLVTLSIHFKMSIEFNSLIQYPYFQHK